MKNAKHKLIITGTGRAGTTFLVRLFTELDLDTGYTRENWRKDYFSHCNAGLERKLSDPAAPYIVKDPDLCNTLGQVLTENDLVIDHALIPLRDLDAAAKSRIRVGGTDNTVPGGLRDTNDPARQKTILAEMFHQLTVTLAVHNIPHTFLLFPRFVQDADYAFSKLSPLLPGVNRERFGEAFAHVAEPNLVHSFAKEKAAPSCDIIPFQKAQQKKRRWRRARRLVGWSAVAASLALNIGSYWSNPSQSDTAMAQSVKAPAVAAAGSSAIRPATTHAGQTGPASLMPGHAISYRTWAPFVVTDPVPNSPRIAETPTRDSAAGDFAREDRSAFNPRVD